MRRGLSFFSTSQPRPSRSIAPGPKFSSRTSDWPITSLNNRVPSPVLRLSGRPRLLALKSRNNRLSLPFLSAWTVRATSPPFGSSSLTTSAPKNASICAQAGPAWLCVMSMTRMPFSAWLMSHPLADRSRGTLAPTPPIGLGSEQHTPTRGQGHGIRLHDLFHRLFDHPGRVGHRDGGARARIGLGRRAHTHSGAAQNPTAGRRRVAEALLRRNGPVRAARGV